MHMTKNVFSHLPSLMLSGIISISFPQSEQKIPSRDYPLGSKSVKQLNINFPDAAGGMQINGPASHQCRRPPSLPRSLASREGKSGAEYI